MATPIGIQGYFYGLPVATLQTLLTNYTNCLTAIAVAGQSYSISGRQFNRANLREVSEIVAEIQAALDRAAGTRTTQTYARFGNQTGGPIPGANLSFGDLT